MHMPLYDLQCRQTPFLPSPLPVYMVTVRPISTQKPFVKNHAFCGLVKYSVIYGANLRMSV